MAVTRAGNSGIRTGVLKYDSMLGGNPPVMPAPTATAGVESASVAFTTISGITTYRVISSPGSITATGSASPISVTGLTANTAYTFQIRGENTVGNGPYSAASNSVTPTPNTSYESIASATPTTATNVVFSSVPQTYRHLQLRINALTNTTSNIRIQLNGVTSGYATHVLRNVSNNTTVTVTSGTGTAGITLVPNMGIGSTNPGVAIIDIQDYTSTTRNKTMRAFCGRERNDAFGEIDFISSLLISTSAVTTVTVTCDQTWQSGSSVALYGVKG